MIVYLATAGAAYTVERSLPYFPDDLRDRIRVWSYRDAACAPELPVAPFQDFADVPERRGRDCRADAALTFHAFAQQLSQR